MNLKFKTGDLGVKFLWPPVLYWLWRVPRVIGNDEGFALCISQVKLFLRKICSLHSGFFFFWLPHFCHPFPLNLHTLHKLSVVVAIIILILLVEVLRTRWLSFAKHLWWVRAVTVEVSVPSPSTLSSPSLCVGAEIRFSCAWKRNVLFHSTIFLFQGFVWWGFSFWWIT